MLFWVWSLDREESMARKTWESPVILSVWSEVRKCKSNHSLSQISAADWEEGLEGTGGGTGKRNWARKESGAPISRPLWRQLRNESSMHKNWTWSIFDRSYIIKLSSTVACAIPNILLTKVKRGIACQLCFSNLPPLSSTPSVYKSQIY